MTNDNRNGIDNEADISKPSNSPEMVEITNSLTIGIQEMRRILASLPHGSLRIRTEGVLRRSIRIADHWDKLCMKYETIVDTPQCLKDIQDFHRKHRAYSKEWLSVRPLIDRYLSNR